MTADTLGLLSTICVGMAVLFFVIAVVVFFTQDVRAAIGVLSGHRATQGVKALRTGESPKPVSAKRASGEYSTPQLRPRRVEPTANPPQISWNPQLGGTTLIATDSGTTLLAPESQQNSTQTTPAGTNSGPNSAERIPQRGTVTLESYEFIGTGERL